ncbi:RNA 3'-terminal phosphate cyclase [Magnetococcales bacterium HHB-1]
MIQIDGSQGEGGGQIIRSSLGLSLVTGKPVSIHNIRAKRNKPGLMRQHFTALKAAATLSHAKGEGWEIGSTSITFKPGLLKGGEYHFRVGTAGSTILVAQTLLPAMLTSQESFQIRIEGGTHAMAAPPYDFFADSFVPLLKRMGFQIKSNLLRYGFFPAGGGLITIETEPHNTLKPLQLIERGKRVRQEARGMVANLHSRIARKELQEVEKRLGWSIEEQKIITVPNVSGPGNILLLTLEHEKVCETFAGFGRRGVNSQRVAKEALDIISRYLATNAAVGPYLADQLLIPIALVGQGSFTTVSPTRHTLTNCEIIKRFLPFQFSLDKEEEAQRWRFSLN